MPASSCRRCACLFPQVKLMCSCCHARAPSSFHFSERYPESTIAVALICRQPNIWPAALCVSPVPFDLPSRALTIYPSTRRPRTMAAVTFPKDMYHPIENCQHTCNRAKTRRDLSTKDVLLRHFVVIRRCTNRAQACRQQGSRCLGLQLPCPSRAGMSLN
ncbi:hypothetical protein BKA80DRAFT_280341 [Phyllosticta citrichinensis]